MLLQVFLAPETSAATTKARRDLRAAPLVLYARAVAAAEATIPLAHLDAALREVWALHRVASELVIACKTFTANARAFRHTTA